MNGVAVFKSRVWPHLDPLTNQVVRRNNDARRDGPAAFLAEFRGKLQADAYSGYDALYQSGRVVEIGSWAQYPESALVRSACPERQSWRASAATDIGSTPENLLHGLERGPGP